MRAAHDLSQARRLKQPITVPVIGIDLWTRLLKDHAIPMTSSSAHATRPTVIEKIARPLPKEELYGQPKPVAMDPAMSIPASPNDRAQVSMTTSRRKIVRVVLMMANVLAQGREAGLPAKRPSGAAG